MSVMSHRGYFTKVEFDGEDEIFVGHVAGIRDIVGFHADDVGGLKAAFRQAVDDDLATCAALGKSADKPYSGRVMFRVAPEVHARAALAAELSGKSLNQFAEDALRAAAETRLAAGG